MARTGAREFIEPQVRNGECELEDDEALALKVRPQ